MVRKEVDNHIVSYTWKTFECEICKKAYPFTFKANGRLYPLVDYVEEDVPRDRPYLMLESQTFEKNSSRMIHIIKPQPGGQDVFKMGRGHESEVRVCDISVSRCHALLKYKNGSYFLEDNLSKFGTLVIPATTDIALHLDKTKAVQIGRSVISFTVKKMETKEGPLPQPVLMPKFIPDDDAEIDIVE
jgi:hypothetical protein